MGARVVGQRVTGQHRLVLAWVLLGTCLTPDMDDRRARDIP